MHIIYRIYSLNELSITLLYYKNIVVSFLCLSKKSFSAPKDNQMNIPWGYFYLGGEHKIKPYPVNFALNTIGFVHTHEAAYNLCQSMKTNKDAPLMTNQGRIDKARKKTKAKAILMFNHFSKCMGYKASESITAHQHDAIDFFATNERAQPTINLRFIKNTLKQIEMDLIPFTKQM